MVRFYTEIGKNSEFSPLAPSTLVDFGFDYVGDEFCQVRIDTDSSLWLMDEPSKR